MRRGNGWASITVSQYHCITVSQYHCITVSQYHCITVSLYHSITVSLYHSITVSQYHCITVSQYHSITVSQYHRICVELPSHEDRFFQIFSYVPRTRTPALLSIFQWILSPFRTACLANLQNTNARCPPRSRLVRRVSPPSVWRGSCNLT